MINQHAERSDTQDAVSSLKESFEESLAKQAAVWQKLTQISSDESIRFTKKRLNKTTEAVEQMGSQSGDAKNVVLRQQQWLQEMVKDYAEQSMRYTQMFREIATTTFSSVVANARKTQQEGQDVAAGGIAEMEKTANVVRRSSEEFHDQVNETLSQTIETIDQPSENGSDSSSGYNESGTIYNAN